MPLCFGFLNDRKAQSAVQDQWEEFSRSARVLNSSRGSTFFHRRQTVRSVSDKQRQAAYCPASSTPFPRWIPTPRANSKAHGKLRRYDDKMQESKPLCISPAVRKTDTASDSQHASARSENGADNAAAQRNERDKTVCTGQHSAEVRGCSDGGGGHHAGSNRVQDTL